MLTISKQEARKQKLTHYYTGVKCNKGHATNRLVSTGKCVECAKMYHSKYIKKWQKDNKDRVNANTRKWRKNNPEAAEQTHHRYYQATKLKKLQYNKNWRHQNVALIRYYNATCRAAILQAAAPWADSGAMKQVYELSLTLSCETGIPHHVDHIIPLVHPLVCGLHCEDNLQVILASDNLSKGNHFVV